MRPIRVLVVDDSRLIRSAIREVLEQTRRYEVVGEAASGIEALRKARQLAPEIISLDVEMPGISGLGVLRRVMRSNPTKVVLVSSHTAAGADTTLEGLSLGAIDFVPKATAGEKFADFAARLRITFRVVEQARLPALAHEGYGPATPTAKLRKPTIIAVAASTGGPSALQSFLSAFEAAPPMPMVVIQHMPSTFTTRLAQRLDRIGPVRVMEAERGSQLTDGTALVAPGGFHLMLRGNSVHLDDGPAIGGLKPRADVTFETVAERFGCNSLGVVLTGMGNDGLAGSEYVKRAGGQIVAQDPDTVAVDGMPGRVRAAGLADETAPPAKLARMIEASFNTRPRKGALR